MWAQGGSSDSITVAIEPGYNQASGSHRFFLGENYRELWATPVPLRVVSLATEKGGMKILQVNGGHQTKSLRLEDPSGKQWVLRTIQKYPEKGLPANLRPTVAKDILQDQVSAVHPFSSLTVPPLAAALGIPHSDPEIVYLRGDASLGQYRKEFADQVFLLEVREPVASGKTENTPKVQRELQEDNDNRADQRLVLRARLLDFLLGDWDRHEDQWRWEETGDKSDKLYKPVPRDRDQVYYKTSGIIPWIVSHQWLKSKFQGYSGAIRDVKGWNLQAQSFDRYFLNQLDEQDWKEEIAVVQHTVTDELITSSLKRMPAKIYQLSGKEIAEKMISRRNLLSAQAIDYYRFLAQTVEVPLTDKRDDFKITEATGGELDLVVRKIKADGTSGKITYRRRFVPEITKEIRVYGMGGEDVFLVTGKGKSPIRIRMIGGEGADSFSVDPAWAGKGKLYVYDRRDEANKLPDRRLARIRTATDTVVNSYHKTGFKYDRTGPIFLANYNNDIGLLLIGGFMREKQGFRKEPYASRQQFIANYSLGRESFLLNYEGRWTGAFGKNDLGLNILSRGPGNLSNFYGTGNNSVFVDTDDDDIPGHDDDDDVHDGQDFYRNRYDYVTGDISLHRQVDKYRFSAGLAGQFYHSDPSNNRGRFLETYAAQHPGEKVYGSQYYAGITSQVERDTRDKHVLPNAGTYWSTTVSAFKGINAGTGTYAQVLSEFSFYFSPLGDSALVIANRTGAGTIVGQAAYFQQMKLGGAQNFRGFHTNRFTGKSIFYDNLEMRLKVLDFNSYLLPGTLGLIGFTDIGRVWLPGESSGTWHESYGGGIYLAPAQLILLQGVVGFSKEGALPYVSVGFRF
ncbi:BamA/TamA family outer membrane protein [Hufsiella ginkgonis]|nr:BamA/TamA family outer membrane protein [Hufsiella ginkgonis]